MKTFYFKTYTRISFFLFQILLCLPIFAQHAPISSSGDLLFWADYASFARTDSLVYQEIYLQIYCRDFGFEEQNTIQHTRYRIQVTLQDTQGNIPRYYDENGIVIKKLQWEKYLQADIDTDMLDQVAVETIAFQTQPGTYTMQLVLQDLISKKSATCTLPISIPHTPKKLTLSDIQLARRIDTLSTANRPLKNGLWVFPNVTHALSPKEPSLQVYFEIYGLTKGNKHAFDLAYALHDAQNQPVKMYTSTRYKKPGATCAKTEVLALPELIPGSYTLTITVRDVDTGNITTRKKTFTISNPTQPSLSTDPISLDRYYDHIRHIAKKSELDTYKTLSPDEKVAYILKFWKDRDPTPNTPENEFAVEHFRRLNHTDQNFASRPKQKGSDTDKGRVYIRYGPPSDIERNHFGAIGKDHEIWTYEHLNYYQFIFVDRLGDGVLELVHATMPGERFNPHWQEDQIIGDPSNPMAPPSDAFQGGGQTDP